MNEVPCLPSSKPFSWEVLSDDGADIPVEQFVTALVPQLSSLMRRNVTSIYVEQHGLTVPQWRVLALVARYTSLPFTELVSLSGLDKAQISRTLRSLEKEQLCQVVPDPSGNRKKIVCAITPQGQKRYDLILPKAQQRQVDLLSGLTKAERRALFSSLSKLMAACKASEAS